MREGIVRYLWAFPVPNEVGHKLPIFFEHLWRGVNRRALVLEEGDQKSINNCNFALYRERSVVPGLTCRLDLV